MSEEKIYVSNATNPLKKVMMCSPKYYTFNGINVITSEWMKKGDTEQNDIMVKEWQMLVDAYKDNGIEVVEVEGHPWFVGTQYHPEYKSTVLSPSPLFVAFVKAALAYAEKK